MFYFSEFLEDLFTLSPILLDRTEALGLQNKASCKMYF